jgi:predicted MFS family arabinose efflux permease
MLPNNAVRSAGEPQCQRRQVPQALSAFPPCSLYSESQRKWFLCILFLIQISGNFDYYVLGVVLDPIKQEFRVSDTELGLLSGFCFAVFYALAALPFARWSDIGNRRTVLAVALAGWSVMTVVFGLAQTFWMLALARLGVGAMEPGATPPAQSLVADYFPLERRGSALAVMLAGGSFAYLVALALGGYITATLGWRNTFLLAGVFGIVLSIATHTTLSEPRTQLGFPADAVDRERFGSSLRQLVHRRSFVYMVVGVSVFYFFSLGVTTFLPSFMIRTLHVSLRTISATWGVAISAANLVGTLAGGWLADRLSIRSIRWYAWLCASSCLVGAGLYLIALSANNLWTFVGVSFLAELTLWMGTFASWPAVHAVCGSRRRGTAIAVLQFSYVLLGGGFGPLVAGALSDLLDKRFGIESLRYALYVMTISLVPAAIAFWRSGRYLLQEQTA